MSGGSQSTWKHRLAQTLLQCFLASVLSLRVCCSNRSSSRLWASLPVTGKHPPLSAFQSHCGGAEIYLGSLHSSVPIGCSVSHLHLVQSEERVSPQWTDEREKRSFEAAARRVRL